eukprot:5777665-Pleurochrysis_carterae.AAC.3
MQPSLSQASKLSVPSTTEFKGARWRGGQVERSREMAGRWRDHGRCEKGKLRRRVMRFNLDSFFSKSCVRAHARPLDRSMRSRACAHACTSTEQAATYTDSAPALR